MNRIKIGVIGTGNMGKNHVRVLASMQEFEVAGVYDENEQTAQKVAKANNVSVFDDMEKLLDCVDAVSIAAPSFLHKDIAIAAANKGLHVMLEKPIALHSADADTIIDACKDNHVTLLVGHVERYNPATMELMKVVENEEIISLDFKRMSPYDPRIADANVVQDLMIHDIDVLNGIVNSPVKSIVSQGARIFSNKLDYVQALIKFENGMLASVTASRVTESKVRDVQINAKNAFIVTSFLDRTVNIMRKTKFALDVGYETTYSQENVTEKVFVPFTEPLKNEFLHFADCVKNGKVPDTNGEAAKNALTICEEIITGAI